MEAPKRTSLPSVAPRDFINTLSEDEIILWDVSILKKLFDDVWSFEFPQVVRIIQQLFPKHPLGTFDDPSLDPLHIQGHVGLQHKSSEVQHLSPGHTLGAPSRLTVNFFGIAGIQGPLPDVFTELLMDRIRQKDLAFRDFLDIFNHRLGTFWFKLYALLSPSLLDAPMEETYLGQCLIDLGGARFHEEKLAILPLCTLFWQRSSSLIGLEKAIEGYFNIPCRIRPFMGGWHTVHPSDYTQLGVQHTRLGYSTILGHKSYATNKSFRLYLGPIDYTVFQDFLPTQDRRSGYHRLQQFINGYFDRPPTFTVELILDHAAMPVCKLNRSLALNQDMWLSAASTLSHRKTHQHGHVLVHYQHTSPETSHFSTKHDMAIA